MSTATTTANKKEADKFKDLVGPMDPKLDRDVREKLITARVACYSVLHSLVTWPPDSSWSMPMNGVPLLPPTGVIFTITVVL